jgi:Na+-driven multidrug efflux pump
VRRLTVTVLPVLAGVVVADGLNAVVAGVLRGAGGREE